VAVALVKGAVSFNDSHDVALMHDPQILAQRDKVTLAGDKALMDPAAPRGAFVEVTLSDGKKVEHFTKYPPGTKENPLSTEAVAAKTRDLIAPVLGADNAEKLIAQISHLERLDDVAKLRPLLIA
jgi:2-methylcitrate dehydratase PrpD